MTILVVDQCMSSVYVTAAMASDVRSCKRLRTSVDEFEVYDVFISHRGPDTKTGFVGFLYDGFKSAGLRPFLDCESIGMGQGSWTCIAHAIKSSPIAVIIFSESYAKSEWCLRELHLILEIPGVKVFPVFYKVEPWEVRHPEKGRLANGFAKLKECQSATFIAKWRESLERASELHGLECKDGVKRLEKDMVNEIVGKVSEWAIKSLPLDVGQHVIGVDVVAQEIIRRLDEEKSVLMLGLWGMGGIGKSTLARELYNCMRTRFGASCFIEDVSEMVGIPGGIAKVQSRILKDLCNDPNDVEDKSRGKVVLEERLCKKNILVVLDDVCDNDKMEYLISRKMVAHESMCIVTSRNKCVFEKASSFDVRKEVYVHGVQGLNKEDSRQVFSSHVFGSHLNIKEELEELVQYVAVACGGVPLVLKVCGALLKNEDDVGVWKEVLEKLQCGSIMEEEKIFECLRISYDALQAQQKEMFLDIACALIGQSKDCAVQVWRSQGWYATLGVRSLVEKALVTVDEDGCFGMHDHLRDMGRAIVKFERRREGVPRRLWEHASLFDRMDDETWPKLLQTLVIIETSNYKIGDSSIQLHLSSLKELRIFRCRLNPMTTFSLPKNLKWFSCSQEPLQHMRANFFTIPQSSELKILDLQGSKCETLSESIGNASKLEVVDLSGNVMLCWLPDSFGALGRLRTLLADLTGIEGLPESFGSLGSLESLHMSGCWKLKKLPNSFGGLVRLRTLDIHNSGIEGLPESFGSLSSLKSLKMAICRNLKKLPDSFGGLGRLRTLDICYSVIEGLPESFGSLSSLESLDMSFCWRLKELPDSFGGLRRLRTLLVDSSEIEGLLESFGSLSSLEDLNMSSCERLMKLPDSFGGLRRLRTLDIQKSGIERLPESFGSLSSLESLDMSFCWRLKELPDSFGGLGRLRTLDIHESGIKCLPESFGSLSALESLQMAMCRNLKKLPDSFGGLGRLRSLGVNSSGIEALPDSFGSLSSLESLDMSFCCRLKELPDSFGGLGRLGTPWVNASRIKSLVKSFYS